MDAKPPSARAMIASRAGIAGIVLALLVAVASAATGIHVLQRNRTFNFQEIAVAAGDVVHFDNDDDFIHQLYIDSPDFSFDSREIYPGHSIDVIFTKRGSYVVRCHIHPQMSLEVTVR